ncbi:TPA: hypothetical protein QDB51_002655 [Burkholderia vietnamiensis]|nr:hypothetical protein [Burkholderia vietnamiensis]
MNTRIREAYSDKIRSGELWFNKDFTHDSDFHIERFLLHLEHGDIKIKFLEVPNKFKKLDEVNICKPFIIYAMRRNGKTNKGNDSFSYNKSLSIFLSSLITDSMEDISENYTGSKRNIDSYDYEWIAERNNMLGEWEFLKSQIKKNNRANWSAYLTSDGVFADIAQAWKFRRLKRAKKKLTETELELVDSEPFKLNHRFALWYAIFQEEVITADRVKSFLINKYASRQKAFSPTRIYPHDDYRTVAKKTIERTLLVEKIIADPIHIKCVSKEDMEDKDFAIKLLSAIRTLCNHKNIHNGNYPSSDINLLMFPESIRDNEEVVLFNYAMTQTICFASDRLKGDRKFILENGIADIGNFTDELSNDLEFIKTLATQNNLGFNDLYWVGRQLQNNLDYVEWLMNYKFKNLTQRQIDEDSVVPAIGDEVIAQCGGEEHFSLEILNHLLEKNRLNKQLTIDLNKNDAPVRKHKI